MSTSTPPAKRLVPLWIAVLPFIVAALAVIAVQQWRRPTPPRDLTELAHQIEDKHPEWRIVPVRGDGNFDGGFFVCRESRPRGELIELPRDPSRMSGVVRVMAGDKNPDITPALQGHTRIFGGLFLFGDDAMLEQIERLGGNAH